MANTSAQKMAELWIVKHILPKHFNGLPFKEQKVSLVWGGNFAFDAVSVDLSIIGLVSTSAAKTSGGKQAAAKIQKLKCDTLYLTNVAVPCHKVLIFSEKSMYEHFLKERASGRFPKNVDIELLHVELPLDLLSELYTSRLEAQKEVSPAGEKRGDT